MNDLNELLLTITKGNADSFKAGYEAGFDAAQKIVQRHIEKWLAEMDQKLAQARSAESSEPSMQEKWLQGSGGQQIDDQKFRNQLKDYVLGNNAFPPGGT